MTPTQLSAIMGKTGTKSDLDPNRSRKGRVRDREGDSLPITFGPTCLITCPKTLVTNVSVSLHLASSATKSLYSGGVRSKRCVYQVCNAARSR